MSKLKGIYFLLFAICYISWRMIRGRTWNRILVDLEEKDGTRCHIWYARTATGYSIDTHRFGEPRE